MRYRNEVTISNLITRIDGAFRIGASLANPAAIAGFSTELEAASSPRTSGTGYSEWGF